MDPKITHLNARHQQQLAFVIDCNTIIDRFLRAVRRGAAPAEAWNDQIDWLDAWAEEMKDCGRLDAAESAKQLAKWWCTIDPRALAADVRATA
jgi:hypothetical protein